MKIYLVGAGWMYEGDNILGIFSTHEKALEVAKENVDRSFDYIDIEEWDVDGQCTKIDTIKEYK